jgi:hypothetical protein
MYNSAPDSDKFGGVRAQNVQPVMVGGASVQHLQAIPMGGGNQQFIPQAQTNQFTCNMYLEDLMKILSDSGYGQKNPAMFNVYFQPGLSPPICLGCGQPLQSHKSKQQSQPQVHTSFAQAGFSGMGLGLGTGIFGAAGANLAPDALPSGLTRSGNVDKGSGYANRGQLVIASIFFPMGLLLVIIFASVGLYDSATGGVFVIQPGIFILLGLLFGFLAEKIDYSFDHQSRVYRIGHTKVFCPCFGTKLYTGHYDDITSSNLAMSGCSNNRRPQYNINLVTKHGENIKVATLNYFIAHQRNAEWNNYIKNTLHNPPRV